MGESNALNEDYYRATDYQSNFGSWAMYHLCRAKHGAAPLGTRAAAARQPGEG